MELGNSNVRLQLDRTVPLAGVLAHKGVTWTHVPTGCCLHVRDRSLRWLSMPLPPGPHRTPASQAGFFEAGDKGCVHAHIRRHGGNTAFRRVPAAAATADIAGQGLAVLLLQGLLPASFDTMLCCCIFIVS